ncbi:MAG TPA: patatin-like phospholipase family protein [Labilithrix sp.]|nr:patatin-like phospholipase family protein [Labilithrix sp.]
MIAVASPGVSTQQTLREWLLSAPFSLTMSSGYFSFFAHTGFLTALEEAGVLPVRVSGASAGALVGASWGAGLDAPRLADELERLERADFWDPALGAGLLRGRLLRERLERLLPAHTFAQCRIPTAVSAFDVLRRKTQVLDRGELAPAICASCALPILFQPVRIEGRAYLDGGIVDRPGLEGMPASESRVLFHHIASRSPWRLKNEVPTRAGMITLAIEGLPRSGPFRLDAGRRAFRAARAATRRALELPLKGNVLVVPASA